MSEIDIAFKKLFPRRRKNQVKNHIDANCVENMNIFGPFQHKSFKRSFIKNSKFSHSKIVFSAWTGTRYEFTSIVYSVIRNSNMQSCVFTDCNFSMLDEPIRNTTFDNTLFINTIFDNVDFKSCNFTDSRFINCEFKSCTFLSCNFDGANLIDCSLKNVSARNLNLDYSHFSNCKIQSCEFSLFQLFYTIGLPQILESSTLSDTLSNNVLAFHGKNIGITDLIYEYTNYLIAYYTEVGEYFPLANIFGFKRDVDMFKEYVILGIKNAVATKKFKLAVHFSELINYYGYLKSIEKRLISDFMNEMLNEWQKNEDITEYIKYIAVIEKNLIYQYTNRPIVYINMRTEKQLNEKDLSEFLLLADSGFNELQGTGGEHYISFSHNSPSFFDIVLAVGESVVGAAILEGIKLLVKKLSQWVKKRGNNIFKSSIKEIDVNNESKYTELNNDSDVDGDD